MRVGISLLTLAPGELGGSETYARALTRALGEVGTLEYAVFLPAIAADAADGLRGEVVGEYRASRTMPGRVAAMSLAAYREGASSLPNVLEAQRNAREILAQYVDDLASAWIATAALRVVTLTPAAASSASGDAK